jgi:transposase-like protein
VAGGDVGLDLAGDLLAGVVTAHAGLQLMPGVLRLTGGRGPPGVSRSWRAAEAGFRFPPEVIAVAVRWYLRYGLSYRDVEELLAERSITVDHVTIYRWVQRFTPEFIEAARFCRHAPRDRWFADETYVKVADRFFTRAFVQNLRRGHYELAAEVSARHRLHAAFDQLTMAI